MKCLLPLKKEAICDVKVFKIAVKSLTNHAKQFLVVVRHQTNI